MLDLVVVVVLLSLFVVAVVASRRRKSSRNRRAATVALVVDERGVHRTLADGREESARWSEVVSVEVVCTPVRTADGAVSFALVAEAGGTGGCLVPLGVGYDAEVLDRLARLPRFRIDEFLAAGEHRPPRRTMVWTRSEAGADSDAGSGPGSGAD